MEEWIEVRIKEIRVETPDSKTFVLETVDGLPLPYQAGQFLTLLLEHDGHPTRRSYSFSTTPEMDPYPAITIKRVTNGEISRWLLSVLTVGDTLRCLPPAGKFTLSGTDDLFFFAAGSGITPIFSLLKQALHTEPTRRIVLIYSNTSVHTTLFYTELTELSRQFADRFTIEYFWSIPPEDLPPRRLNNTVLEKLIGKYWQPDRPSPVFYCCGPEDYMRMIRIILLFMGFPADSIRKENFVIPQQSPPVPEGFGVASHVQIEYQGTAYELDVPAGTYLLTAALNAGINLPYSCRGGRCSTCIAQCLEGRVKMTINDVLTERELAEGEILTCTSLAETDRILLKIG